jgi:hypothetical protein
MTENQFTGTAFYKTLGEGKLVGTVCKSCGAVHLPPRPICTHCHGDQMEWQELSGRGRLEAYSVIFIAPTAMLNEGYGRTNPYCAGVVKLEEGSSISAQILGVDVAKPEAIPIGAPVSIVFPTAAEGAAPRPRLAFQPDQP